MAYYIMNIAAILYCALYCVNCIKRKKKLAAVGSILLCLIGVGAFILSSF